MMGFCSQCGSEVPAGARFCANCGTAVVVGTAGAPPAPVASAAGAGTASVDPAVERTRPEPGAPDSAAAARRPTIAPAAGPFVGRSWPDLVLPGMVVLALLIIGYLLLTPKTDGQKAAVIADKSDSASKTGAAPAAGVAPADSTAGTIDNGATHSLGGVADQPMNGPPANDAAAIEGARASDGDAAVPAAVLDAAFFRDGDAAAQDYPVPIRVSGVIASMVQPGATPSLSMEGRNRFNYMVVSFPVGYRERLAALSKGQYITVACDDVRSVAGTTLLSGCTLG